MTALIIALAACLLALGMVIRVHVLLRRDERERQRQIRTALAAIMEQRLVIERLCRSIGSP